jgi:lipopolysaccharide/colanic/teichoic acid biosynthesis glycosyltransferase
MRKYAYIAFDMMAVLITLLLALYLRNGVELIEEGQPDDLKTLFGITIVVALVILPIMKTHNRMWRYTSSADLGAVMLAALLIVLFTNGGLFLFNRLEMVPRSVPPMHGALIVFVMGGSRLLARSFFGTARSEATKQRATQHVLLIGVNHTAEIYIEFAKKIISGQIVIEGLLDEKAKLAGRSFHQYPILGAPQDVAEHMATLRVHGIIISKLILVQPFDSLSEASQAALQELEQQGHIQLVHFERQMGLQAQSGQPLIEKPAMVMSDATFITVRGLYPRLKRLIDVVGAAALIAICSPLLLLAAALVYLDVGAPIFFWQKRPGLQGHHFKLYKFRTMRTAGRQHNEDRLAHKSGDQARTSFVGHWLRRLRLDELPQLFHILSGKMSFVGPRPLLPDDQPEGGEQRLSVRPGVTGWAQVNGGDALSPEQKWVLDVWYIQNMSLWLDISIVLRTCVVMFQKDRARLDAVADAQKELAA